PTLYLPYSQDPWSFLTVVVRTALPPGGLSTAAIDAIHRIDPEEAVFDVRSMDDVLERSLGPRRANALLLGLFAALALALAAVGVFSVMSFGVSQRTRDIGIRITLGANPGRILRLVLGDGLRWALAGEAAGLVAVLALRKTMDHFVFGITATDVPTLAGAAGLLLLVSTIACGVPALRATRVDPMTALRSE
ncbi:MAG: FtsX-like permease family protein, partial [Thermoanaerobaculia bacterium]